MLAPDPQSDTQIHSHPQQRASVIDRIFLTFLFLIPLMPRPTALGLERWIVPLLLSGLIGIWFLFRPKNQATRGGNFQLLALLLVFPLGAFCVRAVVQGGMAEEAIQFVSRILFAMGLFVLVQWLCSTRVPRQTIFKAFFFGFLATSLLTIFCGITGTQILEEDSIKPSRFFGLQKSTGIFRSFGEFGIMGAIAWSYLMMYWRKHNLLFCVVAAGMIALAALIAQSRNVYLVFVLVTAMVLILKFVLVPVFFRVSLATLMILIPVGIEVSLPMLRQSSIGNALLGTGSILEHNVEIRFDQFKDAGDMISRDPSGAIVGFPRFEWRDKMIETHGTAVAPHNHFLSNIVFLGFVGGAVWIIGLYIVPGISLAQTIAGDPDKILAFVILMGTIVGLSFYEGFFSLVVMFAVAMAWCCAYSPPYENPETDSPRSVGKTDSQTNATLEREQPHRLARLPR